MSDLAQLIVVMGTCLTGWVVLFFYLLSIDTRLRKIKKQAELKTVDSNPQG